MALIELRNLGKTFRGKTQTVEALRDITLDINKGDIYGIIGMSGAGKSTLVRCINFLERPTAGSVTIDGNDLSKLDDQEMRQLRQKVSMIFQHFNLLQQRNVRGNISFAMEIQGIDDETHKAYIRELLDAAGYGEAEGSFKEAVKPEKLSAYFARSEAKGVKKALACVKLCFAFIWDEIKYFCRKHIAPILTRLLLKNAFMLSGTGKQPVAERTENLLKIAVPERVKREKKAKAPSELSGKERALAIIKGIPGFIVKAAKAVAKAAVVVAKAIGRFFKSIVNLFKKKTAAEQATEKPASGIKGFKAGLDRVLTAIGNFAIKVGSAIWRSIKYVLVRVKPALTRVSVAGALRSAGIVKAHRNARIDELLDIVSLKEREYNYPSQLSGGQQQRVAIARALATDPQIILCDEATSALDPTTTTQILNLLREINQKLGITIVIITHEMKVVESICSHVAIIDNGNLAEVGTVEQIFRHPQTDVARRLIFRKEGASAPRLGERLIRVVFDGQESTEPVIANLILECNVVVNIMHAETRDVGGKAVGHMVLQLPEDKLQQEKAIYYLQTHGLTVENMDSAAEPAQTETTETEGTVE